MTDISCIVPVTDRVPDLGELYREYSAVLAGAGLSFEFIFALEPWRRRDEEVLASIRASGSPVRVFAAGQPLGESALLRAAIPLCRGTMVVTLPAYRRVQAPALVALIERVRAGADLATAMRSPRQDSVFNRLQSRVFHALLTPATGRDFHDLGSGVNAIRRDVLDQIPLYGDFLRFLPVLAAREGFRVEEVAAPQHPADRGLRVHSIGTYARRLLDLLGLYFLVRFTEKPLRFFGLIGSGVSLAGFLVLAVLLVQRLQGHGIADRPMLLLGVLLVVIGVQAVALGLIGEIIVHFSATHRRSYRLAPSGEGERRGMGRP
ncbi:MAG TPA: hypothetical protein VH113_01805 [Gemmatimonadales bacterium]|jgi:hypothetical protein|nr:hypothetical protein [Gemmatimonadales bacterium]